MVRRAPDDAIITVEWVVDDGVEQRVVADVATTWSVADVIAELIPAGLLVDRPVGVKAWLHAASASRGTSRAMIGQWRIDPHTGARAAREAVQFDLAVLPPELHGLRFERAGTPFRGRPEDVVEALVIPSNDDWRGTIAVPLNEDLCASGASARVSDCAEVRP